MAGFFEQVGGIVGGALGGSSGRDAGANWGRQGDNTINNVTAQLPPNPLTQVLAQLPPNPMQPRQVQPLASQQDTTVRRYCPQGYPVAIEQAGPVGPEWGQPVNLAAGAPCPGSGPKLYCPQGYPNVLSQAGAVGPEWGSPLAETLGIKAGDPCPGTANSSGCGPGFYRDPTRGCIPNDSQTSMFPGAAASQNPYLNQTQYPGNDLGGLFGGLPPGAFGANGPPDWFWLLWLIEHMNDADKSPERAARDWQTDVRNPTSPMRVLSMNGQTTSGQPMQPVRMAPMGPRQPMGGTASAGGYRAAAPVSCAPGQQWSDAMRKCVSTTLAVQPRAPMQFTTASFQGARPATPGTIVSNFSGQTQSFRPYGA